MTTPALNRIVAGDTLDYPVTVDHYPPSDGWTLIYELTPRFSSPPTQARITLTAIADGDSYRVQEAAANTALWKPGEYSWARYLSQAAVRITIDRGSMKIIQNPATAVQGYD